MRKLFLEHIRKYPEIQPCDAVKLLFQQSFSGGHMITDMEKCAAMLEGERNGLKPRDIPLFEAIGDDVWRLMLDASEAEKLPSKCILTAFAGSSKAVADVEIFEEKLGELKEICREGLFKFEPDLLEAYLAGYREAGYPPVSHSDVYRNEYEPHYRVINGAWKQALELYIGIEQRRAGYPLVIAVDGGAAAGKSTLAENLAALCECGVVHMDDFFLPFEKRTPERLEEAGGNIDYERFSDEVLPHIRRKEFEYRIFDCSDGSCDKKRRVKNNGTVIVEGAYALHPRFGKYYDMSVFKRIDPKLQRERVFMRNGREMQKIFEEKWIPMERKYFDAFEIEKNSEIVV